MLYADSFYKVKFSVTLSLAGVSARRQEDVVNAMPKWTNPTTATVKSIQIEDVLVSVKLAFLEQMQGGFLAILYSCFENGCPSVQKSVRDNAKTRQGILILVSGSSPFQSSQCFGHDKP